MGFEETFRGVGFFAVRLTSFLSNALIFGLVPLLVLVLRPAFRGLGDEAWETGRRRLARRLEDLVQSALVASAIATLVGLLLQAVLISRSTRGEVGTDTLSAIASTSFGQFNLLRFPLLAGLAVLLVKRLMQASLAGAGDDRPRPSRSWWWGWGVLATALLATSSLSGHARVAKPLGVSIVNDVVHLAAGATWLTGIVVLAIMLPSAWAGRNDRDRLQLLTPVVVRFSKVAAVSIAVVAVTGVVNSFLDIAEFNDLIDTGYGFTLTLKLIVFVGVLALGGVNHFYVRRKLQRAEADSTRISLLFRKTIAVELSLGLLIIALTGALTG
ncbi:MAG: CopD family protein, partial [Actinomycetota bacterium]|nr:CopD family protein [Actinomycetota bacterium]